MRHSAGWFTAVVVLLASASHASAQAWAGDKGELSATLDSSFQFANSVWHGDDGLISGLGTQGLREVFGIELTPIERLTFGLDLVAGMDRYTGPQMLLNNPDVLVAHGPHDDGDWHGELIDGTVAARYQILEEPLALAPMLSVKFPVTDYESIGYAAAGTGLMELGIGLHAGKLGLGSENLFVTGSYTFNFVEKEDRGGEETEAFSTHYSLFGLDAGYLFTDKIQAVAGAEYRMSHGGLELDEFLDQSDVVQMFHDSILARRYLGLHVGGQLQATSSLGVGLVFAILVWGDNVSDTKVIGLNLNWATQLF